MKALFAGSFDPFTIGHLSIVERALGMFPSIVVGIGHNERKPGEWSVSERLDAIRALFKERREIEVMAYSGLTADFAREIGASTLLRGVRGMTDFEYERNLADTNRKLFGLETVFLVSEPELAFVSSSMVRELIHNGVDAGRYIAGNFPTK